MIKATDSLADFIYSAKSMPYPCARAIPTLLEPSGGYLAELTANLASSSVLTKGTIMPSLPISKAFFIQTGLFSGILMIAEQPLRVA